MSLTTALLAVRLDTAGFSARAIGINTAAGGVATLLCAPATPWIARKIGVVRLLTTALLLGGLALLCFTLSSSYLVWLVLRFFIGLVVTVNFVLGEYWITTRAPEGSRGIAVGVYATSLALGFAVGPLLLRWTGTDGDLPFYLGAALFVGAAGPLAFNAPSAPRLELRSTKTLLTFLREAPAATLAAMLQGAIEIAGLSLLPVYALRAGLGVADGALFASVFVVGSSALQMPLGLLADRVDPRKLLIALATIGLFGAAILAAIGPTEIRTFEALLLLWGGIVGALYPVGLSYIATKYRNADLAGANAAFVMAYAFGMLAGPPLVGAGLDFAPDGFFWVIATLLALYLIIVAAQRVHEARWLRTFP